MRVEHAHGTARVREHVRGLTEAVLVGLEAGGNRLARLRAPNHERME